MKIKNNYMDKLCSTEYLIQIDKLNFNHPIIGTLVIGEAFVIKLSCHLLLTYINDVVLEFLLLTLNIFHIFF